MHCTEREKEREKRAHARACVTFFCRSFLLSLVCLYFDLICSVRDISSSEDSLSLKRLLFSCLQACVSYQRGRERERERERETERDLLSAFHPQKYLWRSLCTCFVCIFSLILVPKSLADSRFLSRSCKSRWVLEKVVKFVLNVLGGRLLLVVAS